MFSFVEVIGYGALALIALFLISLTVGVAYDRRGVTSGKWWVFFLGLAGLIVWVWQKSDFSTFLGMLASWELWRPLGLYLLAGLLYSFIEFFVDIRKSAKKYAKAWAGFLTTREHYSEYNDDGSIVTVVRKDRDGDEFRDKKTQTLRTHELMAHPQALKAGHPLQKELRERLDRWASTQNHESKYGIIGVDVIDGDVAGSWKIDPRVRRDQLASFFGAWTFFWPFYAVTLFFGDFLSELFSTLTDWLIAVSKRVVDNAFDGVFTVKS